MTMPIRSVCMACGYTGVPGSKVDGSLGVEILLWLFFIVPGLIYSVWRTGSRHDACPYCDRPMMVPMVSPNGAALVAKNGGWSSSAEEVYQSALSKQAAFGIAKSGIVVGFLVWALIESYFSFSLFVGLFAAFSIFKTSRLVMELRR